MADPAEDDAFWAKLGAKPAAAAEPEAVPAHEDDAFWSRLGAKNPGGAPGKPGEIDPITGQKFAFAGSMPANDVVGQSTGQAIRTNRLPGIGTQAIGSLPTDPEQRRRVIASRLFPEMPPQEAMSRVFFGDGGRLAAVGMDGKPFYVDPEPPSLSQPSTLAPRNLLAAGAGLAGDALPMAGGMIGGVVASPTSLLLGPAAAAAGAGAGDAARQYLAGRFDPQPSLSPYNLMQTGAVAADAGLNQLAGGALVRGISPNLLGATGLDINRMRAGAVLPEAERLNALARSQGVILTPGQASGLPSLLGHEDAIASGAAGPGLSDIARARYQTQGNQLTTAGQNMLDRISPAADKTDAAMQFQQGAEDATRLTRQNANAAARPSYQAAERAGQVMSPDLAQLSDVPAVRSAQDAARKEYANIYRKAAPDTPDFALWDLTKRKLDDAHDIASRAGERTTATAIDGLRGDLRTHLDAAYPTYQTARETAAPGQRLSARLDSITGSGGDGTERARAIVAPVFEGNNPRAIAEARDAFHAAGRGDEWNAGVRSYIQDAFDRASQSQSGLNPAMLRRQVWGNVDNKNSIRAALGPQQFEGFDNFMQTVEAAAKTYPMNSLTAPRGEAKNALLGAAGDTFGVHAAQAVGTAANPLRLAQVGGVLPAKVAGWLTQRNLANISGRLFSEDGMQYLRAMGSLSPGSQRAITLTSQFLGQTTARVAASNVDAAPSLLSAAPAN